MNLLEFETTPRNFLWERLNLMELNRQMDAATIQAQAEQIDGLYEKIEQLNDALAVHASQLNLPPGSP